MNTLRQISLFLLGFFVFSQASVAQDITATAEILQSINYTVNTNINFGNLPADFTTATLDPTNAGADVNVGTGISVANILVAGATGQTVLVTDPGTLVLTEIGGSGDELSLSTAVTGESVNNANARGGTALTNGNELTLDGTNGEGTLWIGGTLTPSNDNGDGYATGTYETTFTLTLNYQ